jgi:hypothetical protein
MGACCYSQVRDRHTLQVVVALVESAELFITVIPSGDDDVHGVLIMIALCRWYVGSRPGCTALDPVLIDKLQAEISHVSRNSHVKFANDASSCYDRIIPGLANLASRKYGMNRKVCMVQGDTLQQAHYNLKTLLGLSEETYSHCKFHPVYGTGQGSISSPGIWLVISSTLFDCHDQLTRGAADVRKSRSIPIHPNM